MQNALLTILISIFAVAITFGDDYEPEQVDKSDFEALFKQSPFNRTLTLSGSLILTGIAKIEDQQVATLLDTESKETWLVSATPNKMGWKMVEVHPNEDLEMVTAKISIAGEVVSIRYGEHKLKPGETRPGGGSPRVEETAPGPPQRRGSSDDLRKRAHSLSDEQRGKFFNKMREIHKTNPNMSHEERSKIARKMLEKMEKKGK